VQQESKGLQQQQQQLLLLKMLLLKLLQLWRAAGRGQPRTGY